MAEGMRRCRSLFYKAWLHEVLVLPYVCHVFCSTPFSYDVVDTASARYALPTPCASLSALLCASIVILPVDAFAKTKRKHIGSMTLLIASDTQSMQG